MTVLPKILTFCLPLAFVACQATPAMLAKKELAPVPASLADQLPSDTVLFFAMPDVPAMRANMGKSTMLKMYREPEMQEFLSGGLELLDEAWVELRAQADMQGIPPSLMSWDNLRSFEMGMALRAAPGQANPFDAPPHMQALARLNLAPGVGVVVFDLMVKMGANHNLTVEQGQGRRTVTVVNEMEEGSPLILKVHGYDDAVMLEFTWGAPGAGRLSDNPAYRRAWHRNAIAGTAAFGFLQVQDVATLIHDGLSAEEPAVAEMMGEFFTSVMQPIEAVAFASGWNDAGSFTNASLDLKENAGELWKSAPFDRGLAAHIPAAATSFSIASTNSGPWMQMMMRTLDRVGAYVPPESPMSLNQVLAMSVPEVHGWIYGAHRPELDRALASFGTASFSYTVPTSGLSADSYTFVQLADPEGMSAVLEQLMPRLREILKTSEAPLQLEMRRTKRKTTQPDGSVVESAGPAYYWIEFEFPPEVAQVAAIVGQVFKPSFGIAPEGWLVFSMNKDSVSRILRDGMVKPEHNILENQEAAKFLTAAHKDAHAVSWSDPRPAASAALGLVSGFIPMLGGMLGENADQIPFDLTKFPAAEVFVRNMRTDEAVSYAWLGDFRSSLTGNFGFADLFSVVGALVSIAPPFIGLAQSMVEGMPAGELPPDPGMIEF